MRCVGRCFNSVYEGLDPLQWQSYKYAFPRNFVDCVFYNLKNYHKQFKLAVQ